MCCRINLYWTKKKKKEISFIHHVSILEHCLLWCFSCLLEELFGRKRKKKKSMLFTRNKWKASFSPSLVTNVLFFCWSFSFVVTHMPLHTLHKQFYTSKRKKKRTVFFSWIMFYCSVFVTKECLYWFVLFFVTTANQT